MRVAVVSHTYVVGLNRGKLAALVQEPALELLVIVPTRWINRDIRHTLRCEPPTPGVRTVPVAVAFAGYGALVLYSPWRVLATLRSFRPSLIHVEEEPWSLAALEMAALSALVRAKLTVFTWENIERKLPAPLRMVRRLVLERAAAVVAGNDEAKSLVERGGFAGPVTVVPQLGVDVTLFSPGDGPADDDFVIGYVGRLVAQKGLGVLVDAAGRLPSRARLLLVGTGPWKDELLARAAAAGLGGRVEVCETARHGDVPRYLRRMSVLVLPSLTTATWKEQFGHVLVEAMACGVPVVGTDSGAIPEVIGDAGLVVKEGDADALAGALIRLMEAPASRRELAARGHERAVRCYSNAAVARSLADTWRRVVDE